MTNNADQSPAHAASWLQRFQLRGRVALVTGASGGLGRHFAGTLSAAGAKVALAARRLDLLQSAANDIIARGGTALPVVMDVTRHASISAALDLVEQQFGRVDLLVNNSGIVRRNVVVESSEQDWDAVIETNLKGAFLVSQQVAQRLIGAGAGGSIVNVASILAIRQLPRVASYAASKAALVQLTKTMALELARHQIRVNALAPGYILTDLNRDFFATEPGQQLIKRIPQQNLGQAADLDGPLLLLSSEAGRYMTGSVLVADGGHLVSGL